MRWFGGVCWCLVVEAHWVLSVPRMEEEDEEVRRLAARVMANMDERALEELDIEVSNPRMVVQSKENGL